MPTRRPLALPDETREIIESLTQRARQAVAQRDAAVAQRDEAIDELLETKDRMGELAADRAADLSADGAVAAATASRSAPDTASLFSQLERLRQENNHGLARALEREQAAHRATQAAAAEAAIEADEMLETAFELQEQLSTQVTILTDHIATLVDQLNAIAIESDGDSLSTGSPSLR